MHSNLSSLIEATQIFGNQESRYKHTQEQHKEQVECDTPTTTKYNVNKHIYIYIRCRCFPGVNPRISMDLGMSLLKVATFRQSLFCYIQV